MSDVSMLASVPLCLFWSSHHHPKCTLFRRILKSFPCTGFPQETEGYINMYAHTNTNKDTHKQTHTHLRSYVLFIYNTFYNENLQPSEG